MSEPRSEPSSRARRAASAATPAGAKGAGGSLDGSGPSARSARGGAARPSIGGRESPRGLSRARVLAAGGLLPVWLAGCPTEQPPEPPPEPPRKERPAEPELPPVDLDAPVDRGALRTPWGRVGIGDWALYRTPDGSVRVEVIGLPDKAVRVRRDGVEQEILLALEEREYIRHKDPGVLSPERYETDGAVLEVAGRELACLVVRPRGSEGDETWYSDEVAIDDGVVLRRKGGVVTLELVDWGSQGGPGGGASGAGSSGAGSGERGEE